MENKIENKDCKCKSINCARHGKCTECREHHIKNGGLPFCERPAEKK